MTPATETFIENVRHFCRWAESGTHDVLTARQLLMALMQGIPHLEVPAVQNSEPELPRREYADWKSDHKSFSDFPFQYYREVFSPCDLDEEPPVIGDACDDLADIYGELWHGLQAFDRGYTAYALRHWRQSYFQHWGKHAASVLRAIDEYYRKAGTHPD